jgi:peptidoglycan/LPS O-acetylase OafA/YrhL
MSMHEQQRAPLLDGWRAIAITLVLITHTGQNFYHTESAYNANAYFTSYGAWGVDIFFGLSGLLITQLLLKEYSKSGSFNLPSFYLRRAFRILPVYLLFLAVYSLLGMWASGLEVTSCLLFFRNYAPQTAAMTSDGTIHLWSLSVEEHFYLIWPGLLALVARRSKQAAANTAVGLALAVGVWRMIESQLSVHWFPLVAQHIRTDLRLDALLWGCAVGLMLDNRQTRSNIAAQFQWPVFVGLVVVLTVSIYFYSPMSSTWIAALIPMLLAATVLHPEWWFSRVLSLPPVAWLGRISYSLYMWQIFLPHGWLSTNQWWQRWPINFVLMFAVACISYYFVEKPLIAVGLTVAQRFFPPTVTKVVPMTPHEAVPAGY